MEKMRVAVLVYSESSDRFIAQFNDEDSRALHCGDTLLVNIDDEWKRTRIEYSWEKHIWYFVGLKTQVQDGMSVLLPM